MRNAETVTFGGGGMDRAAHLRTDAAALERMRHDTAARILPIWRGKPLLAEDGPGWLAPDHPVLSVAGEEVFLGLVEEAPAFAADVSAWEPDEVPDTLGAFADPSRQRHPDLPDAMTFTELRTVMTELAPRDAEVAVTARALLVWHRSHGFCARCGGPTGASQGGWQRVCTACGGHHFPRTDPVVIMLITRGNSVLLGRSPHFPEGMFSLLAGFVEPGETIEAAVRRETFEEAGIRVGRVGYLASQPWPFPASLMLGCRGDALDGDIKVDATEVEEARWATREEVMDALAGLRQGLDPARPGAIARFLLENWLADRLE